MAKSKIILDFDGWDIGGSSLGVEIKFKANTVDKDETSVVTRSMFGEFTNVSNPFGAAVNYRNAWAADYAAGFATIHTTGTMVIIEALADGVEFSDFEEVTGRVTHTIENIPYTPVFQIDSASLDIADTNPCTTVKIVINESNGTPPFTWITPLPGNVGLEGTVPRSGTSITVTIEDDNGDQDSIVVALPASLDNSAIDDIVIEGDPSGLYASVSVLMNTFSGVPITYEYSLDNVTFQTSNVFTSVLPGLYTVYIRDNFGCTIEQEFEVAVDGIRPPVYRLIPKSNSFGWYEQQLAVSDCTNPYNGKNAKPNDYKPTRFYNPRYFQPWCQVDSPKTQFRSNYDTLEAKLFNIITEAEVKTLTIEKKSNNIGQRQIMDAIIYDRGAGQTGIYWTTGNIYDTDGVTVIGTYDLSGQIPEWARVGQVFSLSGSATNGLFEIKQIIYDSALLVNAAVIDRVYTDLTETVTVKVDAVYNRLNYETYEFLTDLSDVPEGCYKVVLSMTDSEAEYPDSIWETLPFMVTAGNRDLILIESSNHVDDGILYSTGITHKQRFQGLFYEEDYPSTYEVTRDSRKQINKLDGRVQHTFVLEAIDVPFWVHEKLALFISKKNIKVNNLQVQFDEPFERERSNTYSRINLKANAFESGYEQYITNAYDIL